MFRRRPCQFTFFMQGLVYLNMKCNQIVNVFLFHHKRVSHSSTEIFITNRKKIQTLFWNGFLFSKANSGLPLFSVKMIWTVVYSQEVGKFNSAKITPFTELYSPTNPCLIKRIWYNSNFSHFGNQTFQKYVNEGKKTKKRKWKLNERVGKWLKWLHIWINESMSACVNQRTN